MQEPVKDKADSGSSGRMGSHTAMNGTQIKLIALTLMFLDHMGAIFLPSGSTAWIIARTLRRLSFPLYAYLITQGIKHTHDIRAYAMRLLVYAFLSEIPFDLAFFGHIPVYAHQNVFFTLTLSVTAFLVFQEKCYVKDGWALATCIAFAGILAQFLHADYGIAGVSLIGALVCADGNRCFMMIAVLCFLFAKSGWIAQGFTERAALSMGITAVWIWITGMDNGSPGDRKWRKWF